MDQLLKRVATLKLTTQTETGSALFMQTNILNFKVTPVLLSTFLSGAFTEKAEPWKPTMKKAIEFPPAKFILKSMF